ncbi:hypothetical protein AZA_26127 [Nitrospirillum viridazoti Y2]|nr:hypothetical protein AZA_26127 [Nitrospirillum amazonense Y2]
MPRLRYLDMGRHHSLSSQYFGKLARPRPGPDTSAGSPVGAEMVTVPASHAPGRGQMPRSSLNLYQEYPIVLVRAMLLPYGKYGILNIPDAASHGGWSARKGKA